MSRFDSIVQPPPVLGLNQVELSGLRLGDGTPYGWRSRTGFRELPELNTQDEQRPTAHGAWSGVDYAQDRILGWSLLIRGTPGEAFERAVSDYERIMVPLRAGQDLVPLWTNLPGRGLLRWDVKVRRHGIPENPPLWAIGRANASAQLSAPDPLAYGPGIEVATGFAVEVGGLQFDLFTDGTTVTGSLEFGAAGSSGQVVLNNPGNADSYPVHRIDGPTPTAGFDIVDTATGNRIRFTGPVPAGSVLEIDTATGTAILDGVADRSGLLTIAEWTPVPAGGTSVLAFLPLSTATTAMLRTAIAPAWW